MLGFISVFAYIKRKISPGDDISKKLTAIFAIHGMVAEQPIVIPLFKKINELSVMHLSPNGNPTVWEIGGKPIWTLIRQLFIIQLVMKNSYALTKQGIN